jgi:hypothetical protein
MMTSINGSVRPTLDETSQRPEVEVNPGGPSVRCTDREGLRHEYSEASNNHRHYSALRFVILPIYFVVIGAVASLALGFVGNGRAAINVQPWAAGAGLLVTIVFLFFDMLCDRNLRHFTQVLRDLDGKLGYLQMRSRPSSPVMRARIAINLLYASCVIFWLYILRDLILGQ